jgi:hypothetical protein
MSPILWGAHVKVKEREKMTIPAVIRSRRITMTAREEARLFMTLLLYSHY